MVFCTVRDMDTLQVVDTNLLGEMQLWPFERPIEEKIDKIRYIDLPRFVCSTTFTRLFRAQS